MCATWAECPLPLLLTFGKEGTLGTTEVVVRRHWVSLYKTRGARHTESAMWAVSVSCDN